MTEEQPPRSTLKLVRMLLWLLVALALIGMAALVLLRRAPVTEAQASETSAPQGNFGGPFTLVAGDGKPFSSSSLAGKPYAIFFGYTRCGDVCPTTLARLVNLRKEAGKADQLNLVFVTIDPKNDGPKEVGQYAELFGAPIIGLTGTEPQIASVKKQYGIFAEPSASGHGDMISHTPAVLLFDRNGKFSGTLSATEPNPEATAKLRKLMA